VLGAERLRTLTIHHRRHTCISHSLAGERTSAEARAAAGHSNVAVTSVYLHVVVDEREVVGELFSLSPQLPLANDILHVQLGGTLAEVRATARHFNVVDTSVLYQLFIDEREAMRDLSRRRRYQNDRLLDAKTS
jgi:hypothetical protein